MNVYSKFFYLSTQSQCRHNMRSWQGEKVRVLGVQGLHRVSLSKLQVSPLTQRLYGFRRQEGKIPTKTTKKKLGTNPMFPVVCQLLFIPTAYPNIMILSMLYFTSNIHTHCDQARIPLPGNLDFLK